MKKLSSAFWLVLTWGVITWMSWGWLVRSWNEFRLIRGASLASATLVDTGSYEVEDSRGQVDIVHVGSYEFLTDRGAFTSVSHSPSSKFPTSTQVEYLRDNPAINRRLGDGVQSIWEWTWRRAALTGLVVGILLCVAWEMHVAPCIKARKARHP